MRDMHGWMSIAVAAMGRSSARARVSNAEDTMYRTLCMEAEQAS
jgi:hypothetical protein